MMMEDMSEIEVPEELTYKGQFMDLLEGFCDGRVQAQSAEEITLGKPIHRRRQHDVLQDRGSDKVPAEQQVRDIQSWADTRAIERAELWSGRLMVREDLNHKRG